MMMTQIKCLVCYKETETGLCHPKCCKELFGTHLPPEFDIASEKLDEMAQDSVKRMLALPGVQRKLSLDLVHTEKGTLRLPIVGVLGGTHILKPLSIDYPEMPEVENLTTYLAKKVSIKFTGHGLIKMANGEFGYITKRFDRIGKTKKWAVEDFCQLSELAAENKYKSTSQKAGETLATYSSNPGDDALR
jgi:serine/threonine-protein kinase HipA